MTKLNDEAALSIALDAAKREGIPYRGLKDLLCAGCNAAYFVRGGLCAACDADVMAHYDATAAAHDPDGFALHCAAEYADDEGAVQFAGLMPGKV